jgi:hypothetical protein
MGLKEKMDRHRGLIAKAENMSAKLAMNKKARWVVESFDNPLSHLIYYGLYDLTPGTEEGREVMKEMARKHREALVAYIMQDNPIIIDGMKIPWVKGVTLLMYAVASGDEEFVKYVLVYYDADFEATDYDGRTVFDWADLAGSENVKQLLLSSWNLTGENGNRGDTCHVHRGQTLIDCTRTDTGTALGLHWDWH